MSELLLLIISLVLKLDEMWSDIKLDHYPLDKPTVLEFVDEIDSYYVGGEYIEYEPVSPPRTMDVTVWDCACTLIIEPSEMKKGNVAVYFESMWGAQWLGATSKTMGCDRSILINTAAMVRYHPIYDTPMFYQTTAHELSHVWQGYICENSRYVVENAAQIYSYDVLWRAAKDGNEMAYHGMVYGLRRDLTLTAIDLMYQAGHDPDELLSQMELNENERQYFEGYNAAEAKWMGSLYTTTPMLMIVENDSIDTIGLRGAVDVSELRDWLLNDVSSMPGRQYEMMTIRME
jgi:hypothetical protein